MRIKGVIRGDLFSPMTGWIFFLPLSFLSFPLLFSNSDRYRGGRLSISVPPLCAREHNDGLNISTALGPPTLLHRLLSNTGQKQKSMRPQSESGPLISTEEGVKFRRRRAREERALPSVFSRGGRLSTVEKSSKYRDGVVNKD